MFRGSSPKLTRQPKKSILEDDDLNDLESFLTRKESSSSSDLEDLRKKKPVKKTAPTNTVNNNKSGILRRTSSNLSSNSETEFKEELSVSTSQKEIKKSPSVSSLTSYTISSSDNDLKFNKQKHIIENLNKSDNNSSKFVESKQINTNTTTPQQLKRVNNIPSTPVGESPDTRHSSNPVTKPPIAPSSVSLLNRQDSEKQLLYSPHENNSVVENIQNSTPVVLEKQQQQQQQQQQTIPNDLTKFIQLVKGQQKVEFDDSVEITRQKDLSIIDELNRTVDNLNSKLQVESKLNQTLQDELNLEKANGQSEKIKSKALQEEIEHLKSIASVVNKNSEDREEVSSETISIEEYNKIKKEIVEQEILIKGYQKENERLIEQIKMLNTKSKQSEEYHVQQIQKLTAEIANLKEDFQRKVTEYNNKNINSDLISKNQELQEYKTLVEQYKVRELELKEEIEKSKKAKKDLEGKLLGKDVEQVYQESQLFDKLKNQLLEQEQNHNKEIESLNNKLLWFVENQQIVTKKEELISILQQNVRDLERQLKNNTSISQKPFKQQEERSLNNDNIKQLQQRIYHLEQLCKERDEVEETRLRAIRQEHEQVKLEYEKKIQQLESQKKHQQNSRIKELEAQVEAQRNLYRKKFEVTSLTNKQNKVDSKCAEDDILIKNEFQSKIGLLEDQNKKNIEIINKQKETIAKLSLPTHVTESPEYCLLDSQKSALEKQLWKLQEENHHLQGKIKAIELFKENMQDSTTQLFKQWQTDIVDKMRQIKTIQGKEIQTIVDEYQTELDSLKRLQNIKDSNQTEHVNLLNKLQQELASSNVTIRHLESKISKYKVFKQQITENKHIENNNSRFQSLHKALASSQALVSELSEKINVLEIELQHSQVRKELSQQLQNELKLVVQENIGLNHKIEILQKQLENVAPIDSNTYILLQSKLVDMEASYRKRVAELELIVSSLQDKLQDQRREFQKTISQKNAEIEGFRRELDDLLDSMVEATENVNKR